MLKFRDFELEFDIMDADDAEQFENALKMVRDTTNDTAVGESFAGSIRRQAEVVFAFFDDLFGEGFHREVFGERTNLAECLEAFRELVDAINGDRKEKLVRMQQLSGNGYPNRAARRAAAHSGK